MGCWLSFPPSQVCPAIFFYSLIGRWVPRLGCCIQDHGCLMHRNETLRFGVFNVAKRSNMVQPSNRNPLRNPLRSGFPGNLRDPPERKKSRSHPREAGASTGALERYHVAPVPLGWTSIEDGKDVRPETQATKPTSQWCG